MREAYKIEKPRLILTPFPDDYSSIALPSESLRDAIDRLHAGRAWSVVCKIRTQEEWDQADALGHALLEYKWPKGLLVIYDECQRLKRGSNIPGGFALLIDEGRHHNIIVWCIARRPVQTPIILRALAEEHMAFRLTTERDLKAMEDSMGDAAHDLPNFRRGEYLYCSDQTGIVQHFGPDGREIFS